MGGVCLARKRTAGSVRDAIPRPRRQDPGVDHRGNHPRWRRDGKEIFYVNTAAPDTRLLAAAVSAKDATFEVGVVQTLFSFQSGGPRTVYDVTADGQRFLVNTRGDQARATPAPLTVVVNWQAALGRER